MLDKLRESLRIKNNPSSKIEEGVFYRGQVVIGGKVYRPKYAGSVPAVDGRVVKCLTENNQCLVLS